MARLGKLIYLGPAAADAIARPGSAASAGSGEAAGRRSAIARETKRSRGRG